VFQEHVAKLLLKKKDDRHYRKVGAPPQHTTPHRTPPHLTALLDTARTAWALHPQPPATRTCWHALRVVSDCQPAVPRLAEHSSH
jgi:hypothetical protein